jgi:asparagine synthase (glutamine-hydrolysing)
MCGICGIVHFDRNRQVDKEILYKMTDSLAHRGPDGRGFYIDNNIGLGHRRLSVIDLSTGSQPMITRDKNLVISFNGEIYNYIELKSELKSLGHIFDTSSDTEVILKAYEEWGFDCQNRLNGMWAFAIWDARQKHLFVSRDRLGEKPLYFSLRDNSFWFGSEIKSILSSGLAYQGADELLHLYLSFGYVPAPFTFYKGIQKLMPGHFMVVKDGKISDRTYWDLPAISEEDMRQDATSIYDEFEGYFSDSVQIRMRSDVPYGAFLSGGLDSSSIVAAMSGVSRSSVETFTVGFGERSFDERELAREVAKHFHTNHHEHLAAPETFDESLERILFQFDEPFGDASAIPVGLVSRLARQKVTMVLTGDGGDEVLSGYTAYRGEKFAEQYSKIPGFIRNGLYQSIDLASLLTRKNLRYKANRLRRFLYLSDKSFEERFSSKLSLLNPQAIRQLIPSDVKQISIEDFLSDTFVKCRFTDPFYRLMYFQLKVSLPDDMLAKVDRMSMAHSLEARIPFLDHRIVELSYLINKDIKMQGYSLKSVLKTTFGTKLPPSILKAPKMPFSVPLREWFKSESFDDKLNDLATSDFGLNRALISDIVKENKNSKQDYGDFIWRLFVLKKWMTGKTPQEVLKQPPNKYRQACGTE